MATPPQSPNLPLEAYKLLTTQLQSEETLFWRRNEFLFLVNGGMMTVLGVFHPSAVPLTLVTTYLSLATCVVGAGMCLLWLVIVKRGEAFYNHWYEQLKLVEAQYLAPVNIFTLADDYFASGAVVLGKKSFKLGTIAGRIRIFQAMAVIPVLFLVAWLGLAVLLIANP